MIYYLRVFSRQIDRLSDWLANVVSYLIFVLMLLVPFEVTMRYIFNSPTVWSKETTQFILCALIAFGGAKTLREGEHVNVDVVYSKFSPRSKAIINLFTYLILFFFLILLTWKSWGVAMRSFAWKESSASAFDPPIWPIKFFIPLGAFFLFLQAVVEYVRNIMMAVTGRSDTDISDKQHIKQMDKE